MESFLIVIVLVLSVVFALLPRDVLISAFFVTMTPFRFPADVIRHGLTKNNWSPKKFLIVALVVTTVIDILIESGQLIPVVDIIFNSLAIHLIYRYLPDYVKTNNDGLMIIDKSHVVLMLVNGYLLLILPLSLIMGQYGELAYLLFNFASLVYFSSSDRGREAINNVGNWFRSFSLVPATVPVN